MFVTYKLEVGFPLLGPAYAVEGHIWGSMVPSGSEGGLGHLGEPQVLWSWNYICSQRQKQDVEKKIILITVTQ